MVLRMKRNKEKRDLNRVHNISTTTRTRAKRVAKSNKRDLEEL